MIQLVSLIGAFTMLTAFALLQAGRWQALEYRYLWANALGGAALATVALLESQWGFLLMESVWTLVSAHGLWRRWRRPA